MTAPNTDQTPADAKPPEPPVMPDQLDALALQLVSMQHQLNALMGVVQSSLIYVQQLLAKRGSGTVAGVPLTRERAGFTGPGPDASKPRASFNTKTTEG